MVRPYVALAAVPFLLGCPTEDDGEPLQRFHYAGDDDDSSLPVNDDDILPEDDDDATTDGDLFPWGDDWDCSTPAHQCNAGYLALAERLQSGASTDTACHDAVVSEAYQVQLLRPAEIGTPIDTYVLQSPLTDM